MAIQTERENAANRNAEKKGKNYTHMVYQPLSNWPAYCVIVNFPSLRS